MSLSTRLWTPTHRQQQCNQLVVRINQPKCFLPGQWCVNDFLDTFHPPHHVVVLHFPLYCASRNYMTVVPKNGCGHKFFILFGSSYDCYQEFIACAIPILFLLTSSQRCMHWMTWAISGEYVQYMNSQVVYTRVQKGFHVKHVHLTVKRIHCWSLTSCCQNEGGH